jgi:hypothetical protein
MARRWARTLTIVLSWMWLVFGVAGFVMLLFFLQPMTEAVRAQQPNLPPEALMIMQVVGGGVAACAYLILPGVLLVFCHGDSVRLTCERRDPRIPWTDRCPMAVLALSLSLALAFASMAVVPLYGFVTPLFGVFVSGTTGAVVIALIELVLAYLTWGTYRLHMAAWWGTLLLGIVGAFNLVITFKVTTLIAMYEKMNMPPDQLEMIRKMGMAEWMSRAAPWMALIGGVTWVAYMLYVRKYFVRVNEAKVVAVPEV